VAEGSAVAAAAAWAVAVVAVAAAWAAAGGRAMAGAEAEISLDALPACRDHRPAGLRSMYRVAVVNRSGDFPHRVPAAARDQATLLAILDLATSAATRDRVTLATSVARRAPETSALAPDPGILVATSPICLAVGRQAAISITSWTFRVAVGHGLEVDRIFVLAPILGRSPAAPSLAELRLSSCTIIRAQEADGRAQVILQLVTA